MFEKDGIVIKENFLSQEILKKINEELNLTFSKYSINGGLYSTYLRSRGNLLECTIPGSIVSVNMFEIIVDVAEQFEKYFDRFSSENYILTVFNIFSEKDNPIPLFWHTDNRVGMVRAIIYLKGGGDSSGKFMYMKGTHKREYHVEHKLSRKTIRKLQDRILECTAPEGSLIIFDSNGFHAKKECSEERRIMFLEFHPRNNQHCKERVFLPSNHLTGKVIRNIKLFENIDFPPKDLLMHGHEASHKNPPPLPFKTSLIELKKSALRSTRSVLGRIWRSISIKDTPLD